jgi:hypothetical protein
MSSRTKNRGLVVPPKLRLAGPVLLAAGLLAAPALGQENAYFPQPFEVEHRLVQEDPDGRFESDPVKDTYVGNFVVTERGDGSRLVVDLARREMTEIRPQDGSFWTIEFDRFADLRRRLARIAGPRAAASLELRGGESQAATGAPRAALEVEELPAAGPRLELRDGQAGGAGEQRAEKRRFRVAPAAEQKDAMPAGRWLEVEVDPSRQFSPAASEALARYEAEAFASERSGAWPAEKALAAVREKSGRALAVRTVRPLYAGSRQVGSLETEVLASRQVDDFDQRKLLVPEGLKRRPHPLELALAQLEQEARIDDLLAGRPEAGNQP